MTAEILKPFGDYKTPGVSEGIVDMLEELLVLVKAGEVQAAGVVLINQNGFVRTRAHKGNRGMAEMVGAVAVMQHDLIRLWKADE